MTTQNDVEGEGTPGMDDRQYEHWDTWMRTEDGKTIITYNLIRMPIQAWQIRLNGQNKETKSKT